MKKKYIIATAFLLMTKCFFASGQIKINTNEKPVTGGFADLGKLQYSKSKVIIIDDKTYPDPVEKRKAFTRAISASSKRLVILSGDIDLSDGKISDTDHSYFDAFSPKGGQRVHNDIVYNISSNTTIIGKDNARVKFGGLLIPDSSNIIIRNITFWDAHGSTECDTKISPESKASADNLSIWDKKGSIPKNIWIDHCTFTDGTCNDMSRNYNHDGSLDISGGINVTVSYCEFTNHDKVMLVGSSDKFTSRSERKITLHHNYFHKTTQRTPRSRGTYMHIYNNAYDDIGIPENKGYMLGPGTASLYIVENNFFGSCLGNILSCYDTTKPGTSLYSKIYAAGNSKDIYEIQDYYQDHFLQEKPWTIKYDYKLSSWEEAKADVLENAGAGKDVEIIIENQEK